MRERLPEFLAIQPEVAHAIADRRPVVALESAAIAHGLPRPKNLALAHSMEATVREGGAVPATVAVLDGRIRVGLDGEDLERLADGAAIAKVSRRDLPIALATGIAGATTVAATMIVAALAGIRVFATGGIGGVHRGAAETYDVSADLDELARTDVAVVCAGAKSILDLPKTLEVLETRGVPVVGYRTDRFPAFLTLDSGLPVDHAAPDATTVARILRAKWHLGLDGGVVIAAPVPADQAIASDIMEAALAKALEDARLEGITGKAVTPFLLQRVNALTDGRSVDANMALLRNCAAVAAEIAVAYARLEADTALPRPVPAPKSKRVRVAG